MKLSNIQKEKILFSTMVVAFLLGLFFFWVCTIVQICACHDPEEHLFGSFSPIV